MARLARFQHGGDDSESEIQGAAAEIRNQVQRRHRRAALRSDGMQRAGQSQVVQIVAGGLRQRAVLAPACHAPVH